MLLFATLLFWGWQSDMTLVGFIAGTLVEGSRLLNVRWELDDADFHRIFSFCFVLIVALTGYIFTMNDESGGLAGWLTGNAQHRNGADSIIATSSVLRWLPLAFFPFMAAQAYNARPTVPLTAVSLVLRLRRRRGEQSLAGRYLDVSYPYFVICLFSAGIHTNHGTHTYFWGQCGLILWALWTLRSGRFGWKAWTGALLLSLGLGVLGLFSVNQFERMVQNFDVQLMSRFLNHRVDPSQSVTFIGQIGEIKLSPRIVIRLQPAQLGDAPAYLREASYRRYSNQCWAAGGSINDFGLMQPETDNSTWLLQPAKRANSLVNIACYIHGRSKDGDHEGVLPLPTGVSRLENLPNITAVIALQTNQNGAVLATASTSLMIFDARYGAGSTMDMPPGTNTYDLEVPTNEMPALDTVIGQLNLTNRNATDFDKRVAVERFFAHNFAYSTWHGREKTTTNGTPLARFLLMTRSGHCEYFATATVLLLRELGVPARYAVGFSVHETSGTGYVVRERDAHAWCLVWNRDTHAWEDFDTTPASWVATENARSTRILDALSDLGSWLTFQYERLISRQTHLRQYIIWTLAPVLLVLLYYIIFQRRGKVRATRKKIDAEPAVIWPGHDSAFYRLEKALAARDLPRQPHEALSAWLERALTEPALIALRPALGELLNLHYRYRFDPHGLSDAEKLALIQNTEVVLKSLSEVRV